MASSSGTTTTSSGGSGSYLIQSSGSEEDLQQLLDERKKKRMISNRESARRSRKRKQKQLDDLETQLSQLKNQNNQMISSLNITTQHYMNLETQNRVLQAQVAELSHQLQSLNEIIDFVYGGCGFVEDQFTGGGNSSPILASTEMFMY